MVDRLITSYRAKIYDWSLADLKNLFSKNKKFWGIAIGVMIAVAVLLVIGVVCKNYYLEFIAFILEVVAILCADRCVVKQYREALINQKEHLSRVVEFLQTTVPEIDLYNSEQINELASRLSVRIEEKRPFKSIRDKLKNFATVVIFPIVTYIAGAYSNQLQKLEITITLAYGVGIILFVATVWLMASIILEFIRPIFCRDYDAAVSFREDLLDLQMLHFPGKK